MEAAHDLTDQANERVQDNASKGVKPQEDTVQENDADAVAKRDRLLRFLKQLCLKNKAAQDIAESIALSELGVSLLGNGSEDKTEPGHKGPEHLRPLSKEEWIPFFVSAGFSATEADHFAERFYTHAMRTCLLPRLTTYWLKKIGITAIGDMMMILKQAKSATKKQNSALAQLPKPLASTQSLKHPPCNRRLAILREQARVRV